MLRNVLEDYLNSVKEREFYYPFLSLLHAMGFYDIHITDGGREFGKDFIAKRSENSITYQYVIQAKRGDIRQVDFRNNIMGQLLEAVVTRNLSHPQLDRTLPQKTLLMTTGELVDNAFILMNNFNDELEQRYSRHRVEFWGKNNLIEFAQDYGLAGVHRATAKGAREIADFYLTYSKAIDGNLSDREIELYSRIWFDERLDVKTRVFRASLEADIIATKQIEAHHIYEAITTYLALARFLINQSYDHYSDDLKTIYDELVFDEVLPLCRQFLEAFKKDWENSDCSLVHLCIASFPFPIVQYLIWCNRVIEIASLINLLSNDEGETNDMARFLLKLIETEHGVGHVPGDRYGVSLVWACIALKRANKLDEVRNLITKSAIWLCNQTEDRFGLPHFDACEDEEIRTLVGYPFDFIDVERNRSSFLATILTDLAAFLEDDKLYSDLVNDFSACEISYNYWQIPDSSGIALIETETCVHYPNIPHAQSLTGRKEDSYAEHYKHETRYFEVENRLGASALIILSIFLKDRYFPKAWDRLI
ncbi:MAG: restriction endonuclease [Acidobacteria bacterium]|nr:restriction endonuclease [Acidobacteriota bacterium]